MSNECITVVVRCRPMNKKENEENRKNIIEVDSATRQVGIRNPESSDEQPKYFTFDATYGDKTQQRLFYEESCFGIIESTLEGFNSTIFAYGQTGCGKSFTMQGPSTTDENLRGVIPNSFEHIFQFVKTTKDVEFLIRCSYLELYNEEVRDLLGNPKANVKCELKEDPKKGIYIKGLSDVVVESPEDLNKMLDKGLSNRTVAATLMNAESSRSHSIFTIIVEMSTKDAATGKDMLRVGKLNLVDLAGSERAKKTGATDQTLKEGIRINLSLSVLGNVISALAEASKHIPYRDSKLTRLLQDSLGGNTKTMMVAAISPADYNFEETMSTLRYANRAKNIKNKPKINEDPKDTMIREFKAEIERLRKLLAEQGTAAVFTQLSTNGTASVLSIDYSSQEKETPPIVNEAFENFTSVHNDSIVYPTAVSQKEDAVASPLPSSDNIIDSFEENVVAKIVENSNESAGMAIEVAHENLTEEGVQPAVQVEIIENNFEIIEHAHQHHQHQSENNIHQPEVASASQTNTPRWVSGVDGNLPPELEQQMRDEIENRLHQLEHMLVTSEEAIIRSSPTKEKNKESISTKTPQEQAEEERSLTEYKEKKVLAKKRREEKQQREMQRILDEKRILAEELEELKQNLINEKNNPAALDNIPSKPSSAIKREVGDTENTDFDEIESSAMKKMSRLRKRYEKKLNAAKEELEDLREDFYFQRKQLMDAMLEQEKDAKLYELICKSILSEKDLKKIIDKCRYDDDNDQWVVPFAKKKSLESVETSAPISSAISLPHTNPRQVSSLLPDIHQLPHQGGSKIASASMEQKFSSLQNSSWMLNAPIDSSRPSSQSHLKRVPNISNNKIRDINNTTAKKLVPVPLLTLPGSLVTASSLMTPHDTDQISSRSEFGDMNNLPGIGYDDKKKKSIQPKNKIPKVTSLPAPNALSNAPNTRMASYNIDNTMGNIDEIGTGEVAGPLDDWGFASKPLKSSRLNPSSGYDENGYEVEDINTKKKKTRQSRNSKNGLDEAITSNSYSGGSLLPPIDHKYGTPRLPPI